MRKQTFILVGLSGALGGFWVTACSVNTNGAAPEPNEAAPADVAVPDSTTDAMGSPDAIEPQEATVDARGPRDAGDAATEAAVVGCNASNCGGACCGDKCVDRSCQGCATGSLFCPYSTTVPNSNGECIESCSSCQALGTEGGIACFSCSANRTQGTCAASFAQCAVETAAGACPCAPDAGTCPGPTQVCVEGDAGGVCRYCGTDGTQGLTCAGGAACAQGSAACL